MSDDTSKVLPNRPIWKLWKHQALDTFGRIECAKSGCYQCHNHIKKLREYRKSLFPEIPDFVYTHDEGYNAVTKALDDYLIYRGINPFKRQRGRARSDDTIRREITICMKVSDELKKDPSLTIEKACGIVSDRDYSGSESVKTYFKRHVKVRK